MRSQARWEKCDPPSSGQGLGSEGRRRGSPLLLTWHPTHWGVFRTTMRMKKRQFQTKIEKITTDALSNVYSQVSADHYQKCHLGTPPTCQARPPFCLKKFLCCFAIEVNCFCADVSGLNAQICSDFGQVGVFLFRLLPKWRRMMCEQSGHKIILHLQQSHFSKPHHSILLQISKH